MFYHILIECLDGREKYKLDICDFDTVLDTTIVPYLRKKTYITKGDFIKHNDIKKIKVIKTQRATRAIISSEDLYIWINGRKHLTERMHVFHLDKYTNDITELSFLKGLEKVSEEEGRSDLLYYHVLIENKNNKKLYELDVTTLEEVLYNIIIPYIEGETFILDGYHLQKKEIERLLVKESSFSSDKYATALTAQLDTVISRESILDNTHTYSEDITRKAFQEAQKIIDSLHKDQGQPSNNKGEVNKIVGSSNYITTSTNSGDDKEIDRTRVFIVHGHDNTAKYEVEAFIRKLNLEPIIIHQQLNQGQTIIEKIERYSNVGFGVILYTQCDMGASNMDAQQGTFRHRARQNVVFEHGYLIGKIGRPNVAALVKNEVETPNDISGIVYIDMDDNQSWHLPLAREMRGSGYDIDLNLL